MRIRAPLREEAEAVLAVVEARDIADIGRPDYTLEDLLGDWDLPDIDLERDVFVVEDDDGAIVGWADTDERGARVAVHPAHEGRGIGTLLREAVEARMRERGFRIGQAIPAANVSAAAHLRAAGWERTEVHQRMRGALDGTPAPLAAPVRPFDLDSEGRAVHELFEAAFGEAGFSVPRSYEPWHADVAGRSEPAFRLARHDEQGIVGAALGERWPDGVGYVAQLAVAARGRGHGHGRILLLALLGAFRAAGLTTAELSVAGTNAPATGLYESAGLAPDFALERWQLTRSSA